MPDTPSTTLFEGDHYRESMHPQEVMRRVKIDNFKQIGKIWQEE
jgi:hypothetical protein